MAKRSVLKLQQKLQDLMGTKLKGGKISSQKVEVTSGNLKGNMNESGGFVLKGPMAMLALCALCLVVMMGFYYFYNQFKRSSKSYTVVVNKGG